MSKNTQRFKLCLIVFLVSSFVLVAGCAQPGDQSEPSSEGKYYSLADHPLQTKDWYTSGNVETFQYEIADDILGMDNKTFTVRRFYTDNIYTSDNRYQSSDILLKASYQDKIHTYIIPESYLINVETPDQNKTRGATMQMITFESSNREYVCSLKVIDFNNTQGLNVFEDY